MKATITKKTELKINSQGTALLMVMFVFASGLVIAFGAANLVLSGIIMSRNQAESTKAFFAAEAGVERALWEARKDDLDYTGCPDSGECLDFDTTPLVCGFCDDTSEILSNDSTYNVGYASTSPVIFFTSAGKYGTTRRSVKIWYSF